jgi:hypothetical protein
MATTVPTEPVREGVSGEAYEIRWEDRAEGSWICIYSNGQLRFSHPEGTLPEEVRKFIQVYALGVADGQRATSIEGRLRTQLHNTAQRLGRAAGHWKTQTK